MFKELKSKKSTFNYEIEEILDSYQDRDTFINKEETYNIPDSYINTTNEPKPSIKGKTFSNNDFPFDKTDQTSESKTNQYGRINVSILDTKEKIIDGNKEIYYDVFVTSSELKEKF